MFFLGELLMIMVSCRQLTTKKSYIVLSVVHNYLIANVYCFRLILIKHT